MSNENKCRVCLADGAIHQIFEKIGYKDSIYYKLLECFKEKLEDVEGYPRKICDSCNDVLDTVSNFIRKYKASCKLLEGNLVKTIVKKEVESDKEYSDSETCQETFELEICNINSEKDNEHPDSEHSDNEHMDNETNNVFELEICKEEPDSDSLEPMDDSIWNVPIIPIKKQETDLNEIKEKLKNLKDINIKRKPARKPTRKVKSKVAASILEAEFDWNGESVNSDKIKETKEKKTKEKPQQKKLDLPKLPRVAEPTSKLCDICGVVMAENECLHKHKLRKHFSYPVQCPKCPRVLASNCRLQRHTRVVHDEKKYTCDSCGKGFALKGGLGMHVRHVHLKLKQPKQCETCKRNFSNSKSLLIHQRSVHTGDRPAECKVCGSRFFHEDYLKEHMRLHTGETPFKCPICGRGYAQRGNMRSHISHNHRLADLSPETIKNLRPSWFKYLKKP